MEEEVHVHRYVPTPLDHSSAAVSLDTLLLDMPAMVRTNMVVTLQDGKVAYLTGWGNTLFSFVRKITINDACITCTLIDDISSSVGCGIGMTWMATLVSVC